MKDYGFTFIELLILIVLMSIIFLIGIVSFSNYANRYSVEDETDMIYADLMQQKFLSMNRGEPYGIAFSANSYTLFKFSDKNFNHQFDGPGEEVNTLTKTLHYPIISNCIANGQDAVLFDYMGVAKSPTWSLAHCTIRVKANSFSGVNCVAISSLRIIKGVYNGSRCQIK